MSSDPDQAMAFLEYLQKNKKERDLLQNAFEELLVAAGSLAGYTFSAHDLKANLKTADVIAGAWHVH